MENAQTGQKMTQDQIKTYMAACMAEREYILTEASAEYFIENWCKIESKEELGQAAIPFNMWPAQKQALKEIEENKMNIVLKARQLGFTWIMVCYIVRQIIIYPGYTAIVLSDTEPHSKELINRVDFVLRHLPEWLIVSEKRFKEIRKQNGDNAYKGLYWIKTTLSVEIHSGESGREISSVKAQPCTEGAGRSLTADLVGFDEWAVHPNASKIFTAAYPTINRPTSGKFIGLSTNIRGSFFENTWKNAGKKGFHKIFLSCFADPRRDQEWYDRTSANLGSKIMQEYPRTEEEAMIAGDNVSFPEFSYDIHVCEPFAIPKHWRRIGSVDNGYNDPYAWYKGAISEDGTIYIYFEMSRWREEPQLLYDEQAREFSNSLYFFNPETRRSEMEKLDYIVAGLDAWHTSHRDKEGKNLIDFYYEGGLKGQSFIQAVTDRRLRKATLHEYLKPYTDPISGKLTAKLQIFSTCEYLITALPQLVNDERDPEKVADISDIDNCYDSLGYMLISRHAEKSKEQCGDTRSIIAKHKERMFRRSNIRRRHT